MRLKLSAAIAVLALLLAVQPASALYLSEQNGVAYLSGSMEEGSADEFRAFLGRPRAAPIRALYLYSPGGSVSEAIAIGEAVRKARLATAVDAARAYCDSACTMVFAAGVRRHYVNSDQVEEGLSSLNGLGFHLSRTRGDARTPATASAEGSNKMTAFYARMGVPRAIDLCRRAAINTLYRPNGRTALAMGVATSLTAP